MFVRLANRTRQQQQFVNLLDRVNVDCAPLQRAVATERRWCSARPRWRRRSGRRMPSGACPSLVTPRLWVARLLTAEGALQLPEPGVPVAVGVEPLQSGHPHEFGWNRQLGARLPKDRDAAYCDAGGISSRELLEL